MEEKLIFLGLALVFIGILLVFIGGILGEKVKAEWGFFGLIGPIPIGFWSSKNMLVLTLTFIFLLLVLFLLLMRRW